MEPVRSLRISHVGLRGVVGRGLSAAHVLDFASAFGTFLDAPGPVIIGRDPRASGLMIREGVVAALMATGRDVIDLGIVSTPVIQHAIRRLEAAGGVSIGASHNSAEWNALKFFGRKGIYLNTAEAGELLDIYHLRRFRYASHKDLGSLQYLHDALDWYVERLAEAYDLTALRRYRVLVDCCNGTSSLILRMLRERFGLDFVLINESIEGVRFAHEPSTNARTVSLQLAPLMRPVGADAGFLFDVDSDRVAIATERGGAVSEEMILPLLADYMLPRSRGKLVITNLSSTALLEEVAARHGGRVLRVPVGRQAAMDALAMHPPERIALAGEGTGAVMLPQFRFIYDGIASMLGILSMMAERQQPLSQIVNGYPAYCMLKSEAPLASTDIPDLLMELQETYADGKATIIDGLRVDWPGRWFHVRVSQTEPVVRVITEQRDHPPHELHHALLEKVRTLA
jgi:phosphomannomutase